jgi:hypothetical protein
MRFARAAWTEQDDVLAPFDERKPSELLKPTLKSVALLCAQ